MSMEPHRPASPHCLPATYNQRSVSQALLSHLPRTKHQEQKQSEAVGKLTASWSFLLTVPVRAWCPSAGSSCIFITGSTNGLTSTFSSELAETCAAS